MNPIQRIMGRITEFFTVQKNVMSQRLRVASTTWARRIRSALMQPTKDWGRADYQWWRSAYYCRVRGLELSGLFIKPIVAKVASWTLGTGLHWKFTNQRSQAALDTWWAEHLPDVMRGFRGSLKEGDGFLVINSDLSVTLLLPDTVDPIVADDDYSNIIGWKVTQVFAHPELLGRRMTVTDEYYADRRVHRVEIDGRQTEETTYPNLIGRLTIVHIPNALDEGDTFGHPEAEALVELLQRYNTTLEAAIDGNERQGRPTPVLEFETIADLDKFWAENSIKETQTLPDGKTQSVPVLSVDLSELLTVSGAKFQYASPGSFTADTQALLALMFYLLLEHAEIPEFVMGNAISSSMASATTQMPIWEKHIEGRRQDATLWLTQIAEIVNAYQSLIEPGVVVEAPALQWDKLTQDGKLTLETLVWGLEKGLIDERTALVLAPVEITDIDMVLKKAREEKQKRLAEQQALLDSAEKAADTNRGNQI